mgnify:CR=1 FL=1
MIPEVLKFWVDHPAFQAALLPLTLIFLAAYLLGGMVRNIRNLFQRADLTEQEIQTLHGIVTELANERVRRKRR